MREGDLLLAMFFVLTISLFFINAMIILGEALERSIIKKYGIGFLYGNYGCSKAIWYFIKSKFEFLKRRKKK